MRFMQFELGWIRQLVAILAGIPLGSPDNAGFLRRNWSDMMEII